MKAGGITAFQAPSVSPAYFGVGYIVGPELSVKSTRNELAVDANHCGPTGGEVQVRSAVLNGMFQKFSDVHSRMVLGCRLLSEPS